MITAMRWASVGLFVVSLARSSFAYCLPPPPKTCNLYFSSDVVFVGKVVKYSRTDDWEYERYDLQVSRVLKGSVGRSTTVFTGNDTGRVIWGVGESYVVFAFRENGRLLAGDGCGDQSDPNRKATFLREIAAVKRAKTATIEGQVVRGWGDGSGIQGFSIGVSRGSTQYATKSDKDGQFSIRVPVGEYRILVNPEFVLPHDRKSVGRLKLVAGQCAQFQFRAP